MVDDPKEVLVIAFAGETRAEEALKVLQQMNKEHTVHLRNAAIIIRDLTGKIAIHESHDFDTKQGATAGALAGGLLGLHQGDFVRDALIGAAGGFVASKLIDLGFNDDYLKELANSLTPGSSALVALVEFEHVEQAIAELRQFQDGRILRQTLPADVAAQISAAIDG